MTPEEFAEKMKVIVSVYGINEDMVHIKMDELMCECLTALGYEEGVEIFETTPKWYA